MSDERTMGWKVLTHDWRSPIRHGAPVCDGHLPVTLSPVALDTSAQECAAGWNFARDAATALRIAGLWYRGRPARLLAVSDAPDAIDRSNKTRASQITLARGATQEEWTDAATQLHAPIAMYAPGIVSEVGAWYVALGRPQHDTQRVVVELRRALAARGLSWTLQAYPNVLAASAAWAASDARAALIHYTAVTAGWVAGRPDDYTVGLRDAYSYGLELVTPVAPSELGYVMEQSKPYEGPKL